MSTNKGVQYGALVPASAKKGVRVSHILYADDILVFAKADTPNIEAINKVVRTFAKILGLGMNPSKSQLFVGRNVGVLEIQKALDIK